MSNDVYQECEAAFKAATKALRKKLADCDMGSEFKFGIEASGRVQGGEVRITFSLRQNYYSGATVEGNGIYSVMQEYLRRHGWEATHKPLELEYAPEPKQDDEIPVGDPQETI